MASIPHFMCKGGGKNGCGSSHTVRSASRVHLGDLVLKLGTPGT